MSSGLTSLLHIARDAMSAQSFGVTVAGQNVSNVNTPGYARREAILETRALGSQSYGGVNVQGLRQISDMYLEREHLSTLGYNAGAHQRNHELAGVEALFNDEQGSGLGAELDALFGSFTKLAANPNDQTTREQVLASADNLATKVRGIADQLAQTRDNLFGRARAIADEINSRAAQVADLNRKIQAAEAQGRDAADLKDQRNQVLLDLAKKVDVKTTVDGSGAMLVRSAGTVLVEGANARQLSVELDANGALKILAAGASGPGTDVSRFVTSGTLSGVKEARDVDLFAVAKRLDEFVFDVASATNAQHAAGFGQDGANGRKLFDVSASASGAARSLRLSADVAGNSAHVAAAASAATLPGGSDNAVALAGLADSAVSGGRTATQAYSDIVGDVGLKKSTAARAAEMREAIHSQTQAMREALSGVSLDEEMVNLTKYQRAYEAAAKVLTTVDEMLEELIARLGR